MRNKVRGVGGGSGSDIPGHGAVEEQCFPTSLCFLPADPGAKPAGREVSRAPVAAAGQRDRRDEPQPRMSPPPSSPSPPSPWVPPCAGGVTLLWGGGVCSVHRESLGGCGGQRRVPRGAPRRAGAPEPLQPAHGPGAGGVQARSGEEEAGAARYEPGRGTGASRIPKLLLVSAAIRPGGWQVCLYACRREGHGGGGKPGIPPKITPGICTTEPGQKPGPVAHQALRG